MATNFTDEIGPVAYPLKMVSQEVVGHMLGWNFPEEQQDLVHEHWRNFPAVSKFWHFGLAFIYTILMIASSVGNGIVIWIFSTSKSLRSPSNMFVINLAVFDLLMMLEMPLFITNSFYQRLLGHQIGCDIYATLGSLSGIGGAITNAVIAFDRYKTISSPLDGRLNRTQASLLILFTWVWAIPFTVLPAFRIWGRFVTEGFLTTCSFDFLSGDEDTKVFVMCIFVWSYVIPMTLICFFYSKLFSAVRLHERMLKEQAKKMNVKSLAANKDDGGKSVEIRIAKVAFTIFFLFICSWTPYAFVTMTGAFGDRNILTPFTSMIPAVCAKVVSCLDPWVYAINHPRYRAELEKRVPWMGVREADPDNVSNASGATAQTQSPAEAVSQEVVGHMLGWNFPEEHQDLVHDHWRNFPAVSKFWHLGLAFIYTILMIASTVGNGIVIWIFSTSKSLRSPSNMFVINLAIFDLLMMLEMPMFVANSFYQRLLGHKIGCDLYAAFGSLSGIGGSITNAVIAFDRYKTISSPLDGRLNRTQASLLILFTWLWATPFTILPSFKIWGRYVAEGFLTTCSFDFLTSDEDTKVFVMCIFTWAYVIPMTLICFFYSKLFSAVRLHERMLKEQAKKMNVKSLAANKDDGGKSVEIRIAKVAFTIFFLFICSWTPYAFVALTGAFGDRNILTPVTAMIPAVCCKIVSCIDPWVYAINHPRYRAELQKRVPWMGVREADPDNVSNASGATAQSQSPAEA